MPFGATLTYAQDAKEARKARGAFFTPPELARELARCTIDFPTARVFEPSCGEACFLAAAWQRLIDLGASGTSASAQLFGCELHEASASAALGRLNSMGASASIEVCDFFNLDGRARYDVIVGNPPYIRYQDFSGKVRDRALACSRQVGVNLTSLCSSWAPFLAVCVSMLVSGGNLGMVLPAELLTVGYASPVRKLLVSSFSSLEITMFDERVFPEVQEEIILLVARGKGASCGGNVGLRRLTNLASSEPIYEGTVGVGLDGSRWSSLLRAGAFAHETAADGFCTLGDWGRVSLGAVTGDNGFFALSKQEMGGLGLEETDAVKIVPPGSQHLRQLVYGPEQEEACDKAGMATRLFRPRADSLSGEVLAYLAAGQTRGVSERYKCRVRTPWWRVPLPAHPADLLFTYMNDAAPQLCDNQCEAFHLNSVHGVYLHDDVRALGKELLPIAALNSLTALSAELEGRQYGGGLLKMEPREAALLKVPTPASVKELAGQLRYARPVVLDALKKGGFACASEIVDRIVLLQGENMTPAEAASIRSAAQTLASRRHMRAKSSRKS